MKIQKIVIVGGGFGGVKTALELMNKPYLHVTLITPGSHFEYHGALYRSATGSSPTEVVIPLSTIFERAKNVEVVSDTIVGINPSRKILRSELGHEYAYDTVVLALGNCINYFGIEGMEQHSFGMTTISQTIALRHRLVSLFKVQDSAPKIAIVGAGPTGVELAGELQEFARRVGHKYRVRIPKLEVTLIEGSDRVLPGLDPVLSAKVYKRLQSLGVHIRLGTKVNSCEPQKICLADEDIEADLIIWTAGSRCVDFYGMHPKIFRLERGRVVVNEYLEAAPDIHVIGDNAHTPFSGMAQTALHDAKFVARNILRKHQNKERAVYRAWHPIYIVPVGEKWAVLQSQKHQISGYRGWLGRRKADKWIFQNFLPYGKAVKQWRKGNKRARY